MRHTYSALAIARRHPVLFARLRHLVIAAAIVLTGCNADIASPFDKPDETVQPVTQGDSSR